MLVLSLTTAACAGRCTAGGLVTGASDATARGAQSETDAATSYSGGVHRIVVAYNDETASESVIQYTPTTRKILRGATLMGWSYSEDFGATWKYGGKVSPPAGWAALWGDPAVTTSRSSYGVMFMSNLAMPDAKFPAAGIDGGVGSSVMGGACIARSTNGGVNFQIFQCVANTQPIPGVPSSVNGHFYDGGSMAAGPQGAIYASFIDYDTSQVDIWISANGNQPFTPLPPPFPNYYVGSHPRIRVGPDGTLFVMALIKLQDSGNPYMLAANAFRNGQWGQPRAIITNVPPYPEVNFNSSLLGAPLTIRTGPQFSFDIGTASLDRDDSIRFLATQVNSRGWLYIRGGLCDYMLKSCGWYEGWTFGVRQPGDRDRRLDVFNPNVVAFPGFIGITPRWQAAYLARFGESTLTVNLTRATLGYVNGMPFTIPVDIAQNAPVCSDRRGYWGDYDGFVPARVNGDSIQFMRFMTDSSLGCNTRWQFIGQRQHVRAVSYTY